MRRIEITLISSNDLIWGGMSRDLQDRPNFHCHHNFSWRLELRAIQVYSTGKELSYHNHLMVS
jgi:hypothetical protein